MVPGGSRLPPLELPGETPKLPRSTKEFEKVAWTSVERIAVTVAVDISFI